MTKKVCVIGFGEMGKRHSKDVEEFSDGQIKVAGVLEPSDKSYKLGCEWLGHEPPRFASIPEMLEKVKPDGVIISTPNYLHLECLREFAGKKIPLIFEKPLDTDLPKAAAVAEFVKTYQAPVMVHHVMRYSPIVLKAKELVDAGAIGRLCGFGMVQYIGGGMFHNFRRTFKTGGGQLLEKATHDFDVLLFLTGSNPKRVGSMCKRHYFGGDKPNDLRCPDCPEKGSCPYDASGLYSSKSDDTICRNDLCVFAKEIDIFDNESCMIELENGVVGTYSECFFAKAPFSRRYEYNGTGGFLSIDFTKGELFLRNKNGDETFKFEYNGRIHYNGAPGVTRHFLELMSGADVKIHSPVDEAFDAELISFAAYKSARENRFVDVEELRAEAKSGGC